VVVLVLVRRGTLVTRDGGATELEAGWVGATLGELSCRAKSGRTLAPVGKTGVERLGIGVGRGGALLASTVRVQLRGWIMVVVVDHRVMVRVLHTVKSLRGIGGEERGAADVVAAVVVGIGADAVT